MLILGLLTVIQQAELSEEVEGHQHTNCSNLKTKKKNKVIPDDK